METLTVDASVIAKWYITEEYSEQALKLRDDYIEGKITLTAPSLLPYEVLNAVNQAKKTVTIETLENVAESLTLYGIKLHQFQGEYAHQTARIAIENQVTIYDAAYITLAKLTNTTLYTADEKLRKTLKSEYRKHVTHIKDYTLQKNK